MDAYKDMCNVIPVYMYLHIQARVHKKEKRVSNCTKAVY